MTEGAEAANAVRTAGEAGWHASRMEADEGTTRRSVKPRYRRIGNSAHCIVCNGFIGA